MSVSPRASARPVLLVVAVLLTGCDASSPSDEEATEPVGGPVPAETASEEPSRTSSSSPAATSEPTTTTSKPAETAANEPPDGTGAVAAGEPVATGLHTPWDVDFLQDGAALVSLRDTGEVLRLTDGQLTQVEADGPDGAVPNVQHESEDGLLGLAVGLEGGIYLYLTTSSDNRVVRYDLEGDTLVNPEVILEGIPTHRNHAGGRLAFGPDGYLYITTGDARQTELSQDTDSLAGKILRVTTDGQPAPGNPFENEIWSYGHRNVQGLGWTSDGRMYASEFGSDKFDELNLIEPGGNYGWPHIEGWAGDPEFVDPLVTWSTDEASPSGIAVTDEGVWMSALRGERLWFVPLGSDGAVGEPVAHDLDLGRLRAVVATPDTGLWVVTSNTDGRGDPSDLDDQIVPLLAP